MRDVDWLLILRPPSSMVVVVTLNKKFSYESRPYLISESMKTSHVEAKTMLKSSLGGKNKISR